jgi:hypothetical protein
MAMLLKHISPPWLPIRYLHSGAHAALACCGHVDKMLMNECYIAQIKIERSFVSDIVNSWENSSTRSGGVFDESIYSFNKLGSRRALKCDSAAHARFTLEDGVRSGGAQSKHELHGRD